MPTLFEKIISGEVPATIVYRDPRVIAFLDIRPAAPVHILIVPNKVIPTTDDIDDEDESLVGHMVIVARDIARPQGIAKSGNRLIINCNPDSGPAPARRKALGTFGAAPGVMGLSFLDTEE